MCIRDRAHAQELLQAASEAKQDQQKRDAKGSRAARKR
jgi:hypothetical protein